jgi:hypothetical protein
MEDDNYIYILIVMLMFFIGSMVFIIAKFFTRSMSLGD